MRCLSREPKKLTGAALKTHHGESATTANIKTCTAHLKVQKTLSLKNLFFLVLFWRDQVAMGFSLPKQPHEPSGHGAQAGVVVVEEH